MTAFGESPLILAMRGSQNIRVFARTGTLAPGARLYQCVYRYDPAADEWTDLRPDLKVSRAQATTAIDALETHEKEPATTLTLWSMTERAPSLAFLEDRERCLGLCLRSEFLRFWLEAIDRFEALNSHGPTSQTPQLVAGLEAALDLDEVASVAPLLPQLVADLATMDRPGNRAYALRLVADCAERLGDLKTALAALKASCHISENGQKLARIIDLLDQLGEADTAR
ncbi:MAG: hypothetical protein AAGA78_16890, partial [Pseudomonadota bacterium]